MTVSEKDILDALEVSRQVKLTDQKEVNKTLYKEDLEKTEQEVSGPYISDSSFDIKRPFLNIDATNSEIYEVASSGIYNSKKSSNAVLEQPEEPEEEKSVSETLVEFWNNKITKGTSTVMNAINTAADAVSNWLPTVGDVLNNLNLGMESTDSLAATFKSILSIISQNMQDYIDGVSETSFGSFQEASWVGNNSGSSKKSFLNYFMSENKKTAEDSFKINILNSTPLDAGEARESLYGTMVMGCPFLFNSMADPNNRVLINSFIADGKILSLTPGMPKYNGTSYDTNNSNSVFSQNETPAEMLNYLTKNGLDASFAEKDKRYYTFKTDYPLYFSYLETMLNAIWIKLGLAKDGDTFNLFSFFGIKSSTANGGIAPENYEQLLAQYQSSIGFFVNPIGSVTESVDNSKTSFNIGGEANDASDQYQRLNYITGMGTGSPVKNLSRKIGLNVYSAKQLAQILKDNTGATQNAIGGFNPEKPLSSIGRVIAGATSDIVEFNNTKDLGAIIQSFSTTNGMHVVYPELWAESSYSRSMNFNFSFVSPYGDPLSVFKYVYVPFCTLACFAFPRQAAENGYVSPFFVRADIPGLFTSDLALISSINWTKGGSNNLWTKDGLPRAMDVSITIEDLYPYLSMTRRLSFLSANPSYTVFLDSMAGMLSRTDGNSDDEMNEYFKELIDRVNGDRMITSMWNKYNNTKSSETKRISEEVRQSMSKNLSGYSIPWMHNSSIL